MKSTDHQQKIKIKKLLIKKKRWITRKIITEFVGLRSKTYSYLIDNDNKDQKAKETKKCVIKRILKFDDYKNCMTNNQITTQI